MIVSLSRRTDIPAFHSEWLLQKLSEGRAEAKNPFNPKMVREISLRPPPKGDMEALVLWTRNPAPLLPHLPAWEKRGVRSFWLVTVTGYPRALEPFVPPVDEAAKAVLSLSSIVGRERVSWRYDPIFASKEPKLDAAFHRENFRVIGENLAGAVGRVIVSLYDDYKRAASRLGKAGIAPDRDEALKAAREIAVESRALGIAVESCCEELNEVGISPGACIDGERLDRLWNLKLTGKRDKSQRPGCRCAPSVDLGTYSTCGHGCLYCYAAR